MNGGYIERAPGHMCHGGEVCGTVVGGLIYTGHVQLWVVVGLAGCGRRAVLLLLMGKYELKNEFDFYG